MADLYALIKLHKHELDEKRLFLKKLYDAQNAIEEEREFLQKRLEKEKKAVEELGDIHFTFANFREDIKNRNELLDNREIALNQEIEEAKDAMMEVFSEFKKYEMTQAERERIEKLERALAESKDLDEIGLESFRRIKTL